METNQNRSFCEVSRFSHCNRPISKIEDNRKKRHDVFTTSSHHPCRIIRIPWGVAVKNCSIVHRLSFDSSWFTKIFRSLNLNSSSMFIIYADKTLSHPQKISIENVGYGDKSWEFEHCGVCFKIGELLTKLLIMFFSTYSRTWSILEQTAFYKWNPPFQWWNPAFHSES